jgi:hypothetical protein
MGGMGKRRYCVALVLLSLFLSSLSLFVAFESAWVAWGRGGNTKKRALGFVLWGYIIEKANRKAAAIPF